MRKLLNTLFVLTPESYLSLEGETVVVNQNGTEVARFPLHTLEGILTFSYAGASPALMGTCAERGIDLAFFTPNGRFLARTVGEERGNVLLRHSNIALRMILQSVADMRADLSWEKFTTHGGCWNVLPVTILSAYRWNG